MTDALAHRGPDDSGVWVDSEAGVALGHRRLSIVDLSPAGHQPMKSSCGRFVLVFNGEIYNHLDLRRNLDLEVRPPAWRGHSDTETLLAAFVSWGFESTLTRCVGMFALALWDRKERKLHLARDRMGEKPLYYGQVGGKLVFASELKALRCALHFGNMIDRDALAAYMQFGYVPAPRSIYRDIFKLGPGMTLTISSRDNVARRLPQPIAYWSVADAVHAGLRNPIKDDAEVVFQLEATLTKAISGQMLADVPLGAFLSGGVDSSTVVALMQSKSLQPVKTFTIGFDEKGFDESPHAAAVARFLGTDHHELRVSASDARTIIPKLPTLYDEPFADSSQIPMYLICQSARRNVTVALSGDGGDELFGGYNRHVWAQRLWRPLARLPRPLRAALGQAILAMPIRGWENIESILPGGVSHLGEKAHKVGIGMKVARNLEEFYQSIAGIWPVGRDPRDEARLTASPYSNGVDGGLEPEQRMMLWDMLTYLPDDILTKVDRAAMGVSLETRVPLLDHRVVELAWRLPLRMKIRSGQSKWALRQVLYAHVPRELIERPKAGFAIPVGQWLRGPLRDWAETLLDEQRLRVQGYLDPAPIRSRWTEHLGGRNDWTSSLWTVLMFQSWLDKNEAN